jgi:hypothetical protein
LVPLSISSQVSALSFERKIFPLSPTMMQVVSERTADANRLPPISAESAWVAQGLIAASKRAASRAAAGTEEEVLECI